MAAPGLTVLERTSRVVPDDLRLNPTVVADIHQQGGTALGTSRGNQDPAEMADRLEGLGIGVLFAIGGDGTFRGAYSFAA